jgi:hypothetical protein
LHFFDTDKHRQLIDKSKIGLTPVRYAHLRRRDHRVRQNLESLGIAGLSLRSLRLCVNQVVRFSGLRFSFSQSPETYT